MPKHERARRSALLMILWPALLAVDDAGARPSAPSMLDGIAVLPPPPRVGDPIDRADRAIFAKTRRLKGSARWTMATEDAENAPLDRYACALGFRLTPITAPILSRLLDEIGTGSAVDPVKARYHRRRPYLGTHAPICQRRTPALAENGDYPSGHAANGWLEGLILAELVPDRATAILARARAYGESRAICGVHSVSAVQAGWLAGAAVAAALHGSVAFRDKLDAARAELAGVRGAAPIADKAECRAEEIVLAQRPY